MKSYAGASSRGIMVVFAVAALVALPGVRYAAAADQAADPWGSIAKYEFGQSRTNLAAVEEQVRTSPVKKYADLETRLLGVLNTPGATYDAKDFVCRMLRQVGSEKCVPAMEAMLTDEKLSHMARYAIQGLPYPAVDVVLRNALGKVKGAQKIGVIGSIGARADKKAISVLEPLVADPDRGVAEAALGALGRIGGADALKVVSGAKVADNLKTARMEACLMCADSLLAKGDTTGPAAVYREMLAAGNPKGIRAAAISGLARAEKEKAVTEVIAMLKDKDFACQRAAGKAAMEIKGEKAVKAYTAELAGLSPDAQVILLNVLAASADRTATPEVAKLTGSSSDTVKIAAVRALTELGDASNVELLVGVVKSGGDAGKAAVETLVRLRGKGVSEGIVKSLGAVDPAARAALIGSLGERQSKEVVSDILKYVQDPDEAVRVESFRSLGALADQKDIPTLVQLMVKAKEGRELQAAEQAVQMACSKVKGEGRKLEPLMTALNTAGVQEKAVLLHCLGRLGGDKALDTVRAAVKDSDEKVQEAAIRALADWTDDGALPDLKNLSTTAPKDNLKIIALRGYVRLVASPVNVKKSGGKTAKTLGEAMQLATRPDEKKMILGAIGGIADLAALQIAEKCIADDTLKNEAQLACIKIAQSFKPGKAKDQALEVVATIEETAKDENVKKRAKAAIQGFTRKAKKK